MAKKSNPFIAGKQYGDDDADEAPPAKSGPPAAPPAKPFGSTKKDKVRAKAPPKGGIY